MTSEHIKRAREEYQIPFYGTGMLGFHGARHVPHVTAESPSWTNEESPRDAVKIRQEATRSPALKRARGESLPPHNTGVVAAPLYERWLPTRGVPVEVIRGDSGRRFVFTFMTDVHWSWHARNTIYQTATPRSLCEMVGGEPGCDLEEVVCAYTWLPYHGLSLSGPSQTNEEIAEAASSSTVTKNIRNDSPTYYYTKTSTSRVSLPLETPPHDYVGPRTASLLVDCLLQCAAEEASITETSGWAWLFRGKSLRSEQGRASLETHLLTTCRIDSNQTTIESVATPPPTETVQMCVFRKY